MKILALLSLVVGLGATGLFAEESTEIKLPALPPTPAPASATGTMTTPADHPPAHAKRKHARGHKKGHKKRAHADAPPAPTP